MNLKHQAWLKGQYPGAKPPRREDAESVAVWLQQQLDQLQQRLQGGSHQQYQEQLLLQQEDEEEDGVQQGGARILSASNAADTSNQQHMQQAAQQILQSIQPQHLLQEQLEKLLKQRTYAAPQPCRKADTDPNEAAKTHGEAKLRWLDTGLEAQTSQLLLMARQSNGRLDIERLQQHEAIYTAAFNELCRQVSVQCVERGHLMAKLWLAVRAMVLAAIEDRQAARVSEEAARAATTAAQHEAGRLQQLQEDERVALRAICERHAAKAEAAKVDLEKCQKKCDQLQDLLQRLSAAQQLVRRVMDLEASDAQQQTTINTLQQRLLTSEQRADELSTQLAAWQVRGSKAEQQAAELQEQLRVSTPRPRRDLGLLTDLLTQEEAQLVEQALITGMPAEHVHRLLLGLSTDGGDVRPWLGLAGCCVAALQAAADPYRLHQQLQQYLITCDAAGLARHLNPAESIQLISQAVHVGCTPQLIMQLLDGSLGLPCTTSQLSAAAARVAEAAAEGEGAGSARVSSATRAGAVSSKKQNAAQAAMFKPGEAVASSAVSQAAVTNAGAGNSKKMANSSSSVPSSFAEQQLAFLAPAGAGMPYVALVGVLSTRYGHDANELGGPVTEALGHAQLSTKSRTHDLESRAKAMHREVVLLKRTLAEQRKQEQERIQEALKDQKRKIARREARQPSLLDKFLQTKWGNYFMGIGMMEELPRVLQANVPINNKRMPKREAEKLAREIWQAKDEQEAAGAPRQHLTDVTAAVLERRYFAIPRLIQEVAYNFIYSLGQHSYDADCNLFLRVFTGDVEETVRSEQLALEAEIMKLLKLLDVSINHQATGWLHKADIKTAFAGFFKGKSVDRLSEIYEALDTDEPGDALHYPGLFCDDDDFNQGMTAETIRSQHLKERLEFLQEVEDSIRDSAEDNQTTSLTPAMLRSCLEKTSRTKDPATLDAFVSRAFGPDWQQQQHRLAQPLGQVIRAVRRGSLQPALRATAATAATAVSKIAPVGKFKTKLMSALKVGLNESAPVGVRRPSNTNAPSSTAAAADGGGGGGGAGYESGMNLSKCWSTTNELPLLADAAAVGQTDRSTGQKSPGGMGAKSRRASSGAVSAAVAAVLVGAGAAGGTAVRQKGRLGQVAPASYVMITGKVSQADGSSEARGVTHSVAKPSCATDAEGSCVRTVEGADTWQQQQPDVGGSLRLSQQQQQQQQTTGSSNGRQSNSSISTAEQSDTSIRPSARLPATSSAASGVAAAVSSRNGTSSSSSMLPAIDSRDNSRGSDSMKHGNADTTAAARPTAGSISGGKTTATTSSSRPSVAVLAVDSAAPVAAAAAASPRGTARSGGSSPTSSRLAVAGSVSSAAAAGTANSIPFGMTVGMLSAMEAVRQSWLKEEEDKIMQASLSGAASAAAGCLACSPTAKNAAARASVASFFLGSSSGATSGSLPCTPAGVAAGYGGDGGDGFFAAAAGSTVAGSGRASIAALSFSGNGGYRTGAAFKIPDVPALRLDELSEAADGADSTRRTTGKTTNSARDHGAASCRSTRPLLRQMEFTKSSKRLHVSIALPGDDGQEGCSPPRSPAAALLQRSASNRSPFHEQQGAAQYAMATAGSFDVRQATVDSGFGSPRSPAGQSTVAADKLSAVAGRFERGTPGGSSMRNRSSLRKAPPPTLMLTDADDAITACHNIATISCSGGTVGHVIAGDGADGVVDDVCFTPHAPAEGGKKNAIMMRRVAKGKSLKRLEEVMLMVASQAGEVVGVDWQ